MLTIEVELLHGTFRGSGDDTALTGQQALGEWPPSPARVFAALVAADGTRDRSQVTDGSELRFLEGQPAPVIHADPPGQVAESPVNERFVVINETKGPGVQNYPARTSNVARPGARLSPRHPHIAYVWPDTSVGESTLVGLQRRAARVGYLGCADSPVRVRVSLDPPQSTAPATVWSPASDARSTAVLLPVPYGGLVDDLDWLYDEFTTRGTVRRMWRPPVRQAYHRPDAPEAVHPVPGTFIWLRFGRALPGRSVRLVTETLRRAVFALYQRHVLGAGEELPAVLTGHGFDGRGYDHAAWLALPDVGHLRSRGRLHGAAVWLPDDAPSDVIAGVRTAVWHLHTLVCKDTFEVPVEQHGGEARPWASNPQRWQKESRSFASVFPVVHERFARPEPSLQEVAGWCAHAGLPAPVAVRFRRESSVPGAVSLHPREVFRPGDVRRPYSHMEIVFDREVQGPVFLGAKRNFGLGLFVAPTEPSEGTDA